MNSIILGAGPAGSSCAISLLKAGYQVTIIDRAKFPRHAPGETLHPGLEPLFKQLEVLPEVLQHCQVRQKGVQVIQNEVLETHYYNEQQGWEGFQIKREWLDQVLLNKAAQLGAKVILGEKAKQVKKEGISIESIATESAEYGADYFIDATGRGRWLSRMLGIDATLHGEKLIAHYGYYRDAESLALPTITYYPDHSWLWQAEIEPGVFNWTFVSTDTTLHKDWVHASLESKDHYQKQVLDVSWKVNNQPAAGNYMAVGDAAFTSDPSTSHGVLKAIMSGIMAANVLTREDDPNRFANYNRWVSDWFLNELTEIQKLKSQLQPG